MPLLPVSAPVSLYCSFSSKSPGDPSRQMQKMFCLGWWSGAVSPTMRLAFDAPEIGIAVPALQALAVEDRLEAGLFERSARASRRGRRARSAASGCWRRLLRAERQSEEQGTGDLLHLASTLARLVPGSDFDPIAIRRRCQHRVRDIVRREAVAERRRGALALARPP